MTRDEQAALLLGEILGLLWSRRRVVQVALPVQAQPEQRVH